MDDEKVASDIARFTDNKVQLDLDNFKFETIKEKMMIHDNGSQKNKRKRK